MSILQSYPLQYEIIDENKTSVAIIETYDEYSSTINIKIPITPDGWKALSTEIATCLSQIHG